MAQRVSQIVLETVNGAASSARSSQMVLELVVGSDGNIRVSQVVLETCVGAASLLRASQVVLEVLSAQSVGYMPPVYPTLIGLGYSVIKRPKFSTGIATAVSGREARVSYQSTPLWEWDLLYEYLPDMQANGTTFSDLRTLIGFFLSVYGSFLPFYFQDPDDYSVTGNEIGTGDGVTTQFQLIRTYGGTDGAGSEPIGGLIPLATFNIYDNGTLVSPSAYTVNTGTPVNNFVTFTAAPSAGHIITVDMSYYYYARFKDDTYDFEKFMHNLWSQKTLTIFSVRN